MLELTITVISGFLLLGVITGCCWVLFRTVTVRQMIVYLWLSGMPIYCWKLGGTVRVIMVRLSIGLDDNLLFDVRWNS
jgi:hypothetical protein